MNYTSWTASRQLLLIRQPGRSVSGDPGSPAFYTLWRCRIGVRHDKFKHTAINYASNLDYGFSKFYHFIILTYIKKPGHQARVLSLCM